MICVILSILMRAFHFLSHRLGYMGHLDPRSPLHSVFVGYIVRRLI
jgi:hypothetical protein